MDETSDIDTTGAPSTALLSNAMIGLVASLADDNARPLELSDDPLLTPRFAPAELDAIERYMGDILDEVLGIGTAERPMRRSLTRSR